MDFWCRIIVEGKARLGLRQDEKIHIYEGDLFSSPVPTGQELDVKGSRVARAC
jgi:hypothetical protein